MNVKRAVTKLEGTATKSTDEMMHLSRLLGQVDACLWPARFQSIQNFHGLMAAQADYHCNGVSFVLEGGTDSAWKTSERARAGMVDAGYASHCEGGKIRMTLLGDCVARMACRLPALGNPITEHLFEKLGELPPERNGGWVSEAALFGLADDTDCDQLHEGTEFLMPLTACRALEVSSSTTARIFYRRLLDTLPNVEVPQVESSCDCVDQYTQEFCRQMDLRKTASYSGSQIWIPLAGTR